MKTEKLNHSKFKVLLYTLILGVILIFIIVFQTSKASYRTTQSINVANGNVNYSSADLNVVAIYLQDEENKETYNSSNTIPTKGYKLNDNSYCKVNGTIDNTTTIEYDIDTQTLTITPMNTKGTKCYLYFDIFVPASEFLLSLVNNYSKNSTELITLEEPNDGSSCTNTLAYDDFQNLRYTGNNPCNYITFNNELWRIIGIFSENIKITKANTLDSDMAWNENGIANWDLSTLKVYLNGDNYYETFLEKDIINCSTWNLGTIETRWTKANAYYESERSSITFDNYPNTWKGYIALLYPSDYGYAVSVRSCLDTTVNNYDTRSDCYNNNWIYISDLDQWFLTTNNTNNYAFYLRKGGGSMQDRMNVSTKMSIRPTLFLKHNISKVSGTGTEKNPYIFK